MKMMRSSTCMLTVLLASPGGLASEFTCRANNEIRIISIEYEHSGWQVPCRVKYEKPAENLIEYPWNAQASAGYCEDRAKFLAAKLENWGWTCEERPMENETP
jgi:hypothetical protein